MPPDHISTWERPPFGRDKSNRYEGDRCGSVRKDWPPERPYHRSSSSLVLSSGSLPGPSSKRRAAGFVGRQDLAVENGICEGTRCEGGLDRHSQTSSPRCPSSSPSFSSGKSQRDPGNLPGRAACNGSPKSGRTCRDTEGLRQSKESKQSPFTEGRHLGSLKPVSGLSFSQSYGSPSVSGGLDVRDLERLKPGCLPSWDALNKDHSGRDIGCSKVECAQKTSSFPKLVIGDWQAEGRLDRYGSASSKEHTVTDVLNSLREPSWHEWRLRDKPVSSSISPHTPPYSLSSSIGRDSAIFLHNQNVQLGRSPSQDSTLCSTAQNDTSPTDSGLSYVTKRPRLTWGQGLAKYEKEKTEEGPCFSKMALEEAHRDLATAVEDQISSPGDGCAVSRQDSSYPSELHTPTSGNARVFSQEGSAMHVCGSPTETFGGSEVTRVDGFDQQDAIDRLTGVVLSSCDSRERDTLFHDPAGVGDAQCSLGSHSNNASSMPKLWLMQQVEKLEVQVDLVEKELTSLGNGTEATVEHSIAEDSQMSRDQGSGLPVSCGMECTGQVTLHDYSADCPVANSFKEKLAMGMVAMDHNDGMCKTSEATHWSISGVTDEMTTDQVVLDESCSQNTIQHSERGIGVASEGSILQANKELAMQSSAALSHLLYGTSGMNSSFVNGKLYGCPSEAPAWSCNNVSHESKEKLLELKVVEEKRWLRFKERVSALKYRLLRKQAGYHNRREETKAHWESSSDPFREYLRMPSMMLGGKERESCRFVTSNALVEDPIAAEEERKHVNPWSEEEKNVFLEKYSVLGKSFKNIASFLPRKTIADCVEYYYRNQKSEEFEKVHHRHRLKKRRDQVRSSATYLSTTTSVSSRRRESSATEGLMSVATAAIAVQRDISRGVKNSITISLDDTTKVPRDRTLIKQGCNLASPRSINDNFAGARAGRRVLGNNVKPLEEAVEQQWTERERELFTAAVALFGKDFYSVSSHIGSRSQGQCKAFFKKMRKHLGLDELVQQFKSPKEGFTDCRQGLHVSEDAKPLPKVEEGDVVVDRQEAVAREVDASILPTDHSSVFVTGLGNYRGESCMDKHVVNESENVVESAACQEDQVSRNITVAILLVNVDVSASLPDSCNDVERQVSFIETGGACLDGFQSISQAAGDAVQSSAEVPSLTCMEALKFQIEPVGESMDYTDSYSIPLSEMPPTAVQDELPSCAPLPDTRGATSLTMAQVGDAKSTDLDAKSRREPTTWTHEEKDKFLDILCNYGKDWDRLCQSLPAKSLTNIKTFFQNSKTKLGLFSEGIGCNSWRGGLSRKRKAEESEPNENGYGGEFSLSKGLNVAGWPKSKVVTDENFSLDALVGRTPFPQSQMETQLESLGGTQKSFHSISSLPGSGVFATISAPIYSHPKQQSRIHLPALPSQMANFQTSSQSLVSQALQQSSLTLGPLQQSSLTLGPLQESQRQEQQPCQEQLIVQHVFKQPTQLHQLHHQVVDAVPHQQLQFQWTQQQHQLMQKQQTLQLSAQDVPQHIQAMGHHQGQAHCPLMLPAVSQQLQGSYPVASLLRASSGQYNPATISQLPVGLFQAQTCSIQPRSHASSQQQVPQHQQQVQQQLQMQQQKMLLQVHQAQVQQLQGKFLGNSQLQNASFSHEQLQLAPMRGFTQVSESPPSDIAVQCGTCVPTNSRFRDPALDGVQESLGVSQCAQVTAVSQCSADAQVRGADVKLFGQSLLSQPACSTKQTHACSSSTSSFPGYITGASLNLDTTTSSSDWTSKLHVITRDQPVQSNGWQHITNNESGWPSCLFASISGGRKGPGLGGIERESATVQEMRSGVREREESSVLSHSANMMRSGRNLPNVTSHKADYVMPFDIRKGVREIEEVSVLSHSTCPTKGGGSLSEVLLSKVEHVFGMEKASTSTELKSSEQGVLLKQGKGGSFPSVKTTSELQAPPGLPRVLDALVALAEWRLQNSSGSTNKLTEEFLSQSWEALQRDPGSLVEAGKASASRSQGGLETLQHLRESILKYQPHLMNAHSSDGGANSWRSNVPSSQQYMASSSTSVCSHSGSQIPSRPEDFGMVKLYFTDGNNGAVS